MAPAVGQQALFFLWAMGFGAGLHVCYRFLGALRQRAPALTVMADGVFLLTAAWALTVYLLGVCRGQFQLYQLLGFACGAALTQAALGRVLNRLFGLFWRTAGMVCRPLKKIWEFMKMLFSKGKKSVRIIPKRLLRRKRPGGKNRIGNQRA